MPYLGPLTYRAIILSNAAKRRLRLIIGVLVSALFMPLAMAEHHRNGPNSYRDAITQVERELGPQHYAVVEPAVGLGLNLQRNDQHADAIDAFQRALHVNRINKGLHHLDHVPIVDMIVHSHLQLGDWQSAEQQQQLRFWIHKRELETAGARLTQQTVNQFVDASLQYANWQGKSHHFETNKFPLQQLREAQDALLDARELLLEHSPTTDPRHLRILNSAAINHYDIVVYLTNSAVDPVTGSYVSDQDMSDYLLRQNVIVENYRDGTAALQEVNALTAGGPNSVEHAMAVLNLANWQLLFKRHRAAKKEYVKAFQAFVQAGLTRDTVNKRLGEPERISTFTLESEFSADSSDKILSERRSSSSDQGPVDNRPYVVAVFDVTQSGQVRNVDIEKSWPKGNRGIRRDARERLAFSTFRPSLQDGKPVAKKNIKIRYVFDQKTFK